MLPWLRRINVASLVLMFACWGLAIWAPGNGSRWAHTGILLFALAVVTGVLAFGVAFAHVIKEEEGN